MDSDNEMAGHVLLPGKSDKSSESKGSKNDEGSGNEMTGQSSNLEDVDESGESKHSEVPLGKFLLQH